MNLDCLANRIAWRKTRDARIRKTLFRTASGWSDCPKKVLWYPYYPHDDLEKQPWNKNFKTNIPIEEQVSFYLACDSKLEVYYIVAGKRYDDIYEAKNAMYDELFIKPAIIPFFDAIAKKLKAEARRDERMAVKFNPAFLAAECDFVPGVVA